MEEYHNGYTPNPADEPGYTVTPNGGYYTKPRQEIIQDEPIAHQPVSQAEMPNEIPNETPKPVYGAGFEQPTPEPPVSQPQKRKEKKKHSTATVLLAALLAAVVGAAGCFAVLYYCGNLFSDNSTVSIIGGGSNVNITVDETVASSVEAVAKKATASVVGIRTTTSVISFFGGSDEAKGEGSGVVYSSDGYIITNYHVIESAVESAQNAKISVFLESGSSKSYDAAVIGYNISSDLAVLKINVKGLTPVEIGNSDDLKIGQYVVTIGSPGGLEFMGSVTYGVISGLNRVVSSDSDVKLIQTDAAINPGNSGGALLNTKGQLIGINSSKIVSTEFEGMGFSIPVNTVVEKCKKIIERQNDPEPYIGISISKKYTAEVLAYYGYPAGAVVLSVDRGSPADEAGIRRGDIITEFGGKEIGSFTLLEEYVSDCKPGKSVSVKLYRSGRYYSTTVTVASDGANQ